MEHDAEATGRNTKTPAHDAEAATYSADIAESVGVMIGDYSTQNITVSVEQPPPPAVRSAYLSQVRQIAPLALLARKAELAALAEFCTRPDAGSYLWWRAGAWAGKTALMSWFVINPPPRTRIVSFFVTGRYAGQDTWDAFVDVVIDQLADLLGEPLPAHGTTGGRIPDLYRMLENAASVCQAEGHRLILVVDGLDEDSGVDEHSIAALLPKRPPDGMRVIVSGRPDPPLPADVQSGHPLRDPAIVRTMTPSPRAEDIRRECERELKQLLRGTDTQRDVLGLLTAAGGGLTCRDLAELTGRAGGEVEVCLHAVAGRTFSRRPSLGWAEADAASEVYLLGHEELQRAAVKHLGTHRLADYRQALHSWAQRYRLEGWPEETPEYVLRGYFRMLQAVGDVPRMIECGLDRLRHERLRAMSGADASALAEIDATREAVLAQAEPDLRSMALLAIHRELLALRSDRIPVSLPAVWGAAGRPARAENIARSITERRAHVRALCELVEALSEHGDNDRAEALADALILRVVAALRQDPGIDRELSDVAGILTRCGHEAQAEAVARAIPTEYFSLRALGSVLRELALRGERDRAEELADELVDRVSDPDLLFGPVSTDPEPGAVEIVETFFGVREVHQTISMLVGTLGYIGFPAHAEAVSESFIDESLKSNHLSTLYSAIAGDIREMGNYYEPLDTFFGLQQEDRVPMALTRVARKVAHRGEFDRAWEVACGITHPQWLARAQTEVAREAARAGAVELAWQFAQEAERVTRGITNGSTVMFMLSSAADAFVAVGQAHEARTVARRVEEIDWTAVDDDNWQQLQRNRVRALAAAGLIDDAKRIAYDTCHESELPLSYVARALADAEDIDGALEVILDNLEGAYAQSTLSHVARAAARLGNLDQAEAIADDITDPTELAKAVADIGTGWARAEDLDMACALITEAESYARAATDRYTASRPWVHIVKAWREAGMHGRARDAANEAERRARRLADPENLSWQLADVAEALAAAGYLDRAEALAMSLATLTDRPHHQAQALVNLVPYVPPQHATRLVAHALKAGAWRTSADALAVLAPDVLMDVVDACCELLCQ
ncbi:hypothetical protein ACWEQ2_31420 [Streptomyces sp. NPDC004096]